MRLRGAEIEIEPLAAENGETYLGQSHDVEVRFRNDAQGRAVTVFPEPPATLRHLQSDGTCTIDDGGAWGDGVFSSPPAP